MSKEFKKAVYWFLSVYLVLWIILFEFILPVNNILPKPSIVVASFPSLVSDYQLFPNYLSTVAVIYLSLFCAYFAVYLTGRLQGKGSRMLTNFIFSLEWFSEYIPGIILGLLLLFWFPATEYIEFLFAFFYAFIPMMIKQQKAAENIPEEYITSSDSLGITSNFFRKSVIWKFSQMEIFRKINAIHFNLWLVLIAFEYIKGGYGIGNIFHKALIYMDLSAFFSALIITGFSVFIGNLALNYIHQKTIFWK